MAIPPFYAVIDNVPPVETEFVACLGRPASLPPLGDDRLLVVEEFSEETFERIAAIDPARMTGGLCLVTTRQAQDSQPTRVLRAQKLLCQIFTKFVLTPQLTLRIPDLLKLRPESTDEYLHNLNVYHNTPLHLSHNLVDKLEQARIGLPCLILMPGPTLERIREHLPELAKRHLIVTISRVIPFLRECGLAPDVVVQLDTVPIQAHFYHPDDRFPRSILLALSLAPIRSFANQFRQLFFIDSFDLAALPNESRIRESWLSSLLACLGAAEALHAPRVLVAGADLRYFDEQIYHGDGDIHAYVGQKTHTAALTNQGDTLTLTDYQGHTATTSLQYFATAGEVEQAAREIQASQGTTFANLCPQGLLDPDIFEPTTVERELAAAPLDKEAFLAKADAAAAGTETIHLRILRARYTRELVELKRQRDMFACMKIGSPDTRPQHVFYRYVAANLPWFRPEGRDNLARLADNLGQELVSAVRFARNVTSLFFLAEKGTPLPLLCTAEEEAEIMAGLARFQPRWKWRPLGVRQTYTGRDAPSGGGLELSSLHDWISFQDVVVAAPGFAREYDYVLSLVSGDNVVAATDLLPYAGLIDSAPAP